MLAVNDEKSPTIPPPIAIKVSVLLKFFEIIFSASLFAFEKDFNFSLAEYSNMNNL